MVLKKILSFAVFCFVLTVSSLVLAQTSDVSQQEKIDWNYCLKETAKRHPDLISAKAQVEQYQASKKEVASGFLPQVSADLSASRNSSNQNGKNTKTNYYSYGVSANQLLFDGFKKSADLKTALARENVSRCAYSFTSAQVRYNLRLAFINVLTAQEQVVVQKEIVRIRTQDTALIKLRYESGLEHKGSLLTAQANLERASFELDQAKRYLELNKHVLSRLAGFKNQNNFIVSGDFSQDVGDDNPNFEVLADKHPQNLQAIAAKNAADFGIDSARADFFPQAGLSASAGENGSHWQPNNKENNYGLSVRVPLFEGGLLTARSMQAKAVYKQATADQQSTRDNLIISMERAWKSFQDTVGSVEVQKKILEAAQERSRIAEAEYSSGFISFNDWTLIQNELVQSKISYLSAQSGVLSAQADWQLAKGETIEYENN
jgi:outer membrane protein TolC